MVMVGSVWGSTLGPPLRFLFWRRFNYIVDPSPPIMLLVNCITRNASSLHFPKHLTTDRYFPKFKLLIPELVYAKTFSVRLQTNKWQLRDQYSLFTSLHFTLSDRFMLTRVSVRSLWKWPQKVFISWKLDKVYNLYSTGLDFLVFNSYEIKKGSFYMLTPLFDWSSSMYLPQHKLTSSILD